MKVEEDGLQFEPSTVAAERITEDADYEGIRVKFIGYVGNARVPIQIDLGFGDVITPAPVELEFPSLLEVPKPKLLTYPRESVVAEKFEAMVSLGLTNSRMKDLYDLRTLSRGFSFKARVLSEAIKKTFDKPKPLCPRVHLWFSRLSSSMTPTSKNSGGHSVTRIGIMCRKYPWSKLVSRLHRSLAPCWRR